MPPALLDTNVIVYAVYRGSPFYGEAALIVDRALKEKGRFCIAPQILMEFASVVTRPRLAEPVLVATEVERITDLLYRSRRLGKIYPRRGTAMRAIREGTRLGISGPRWHDLFLAMTMRDASVHEIVTENEDDFRRFPFVRVRRIREALSH